MSYLDLEKKQKWWDNYNIKRRKGLNYRLSNSFRRSSLKERFHQSYRKMEHDCWEWNGTIHSVHGYGIIQENRKDLLAHRVAWKLYYGDTNNLCVLHKCDNRICVNPDHLFLGSRVDNNLDRNNKGRQAKGEKQHSAKLTEKEVIEIRQRIAVFNERCINIAEDYNVSRSAINQIKLRKTWKHLGA